MIRTFCTVIRDPAVDEVLLPYGEAMAKARHWAFREIHVHKRPVADVKRDCIELFEITARQFNGLRFDLDQAVGAWKGTLEYRVSQIGQSIEATKERIAALGRRMDKAKTDKRRASLHFQQVGKKQRLDVLKGRLAKAKSELEAGRPRICFGGRELLRNGEVTEWRAKRNSRIVLVGAKCETHGNQSAQWDGEALKLRLPDAIGGGWRTLTGVSFRYGQEQVEQALNSGIATTWSLFVDDEGRWRAHVTFNAPDRATTTDVRKGMVGLDLNVDHVAGGRLDRCGNPVERLTLPFPEHGAPAGGASVVIGDAVRDAVLLAKKHGVPLAIEDLDFARKKAGLREYGPAHARRLSGFSYAAFKALVASRCERENVELVKVNPAFTSVIGRTKYARWRSMTVHHAAAMTIGRAAMGYGERLVRMDGSVLDAPARMLPRGDRRRWRGVRGLPRETGRETQVVRTSGSGMGIHAKGAPQGAAPATDEPQGERPGRRRTRNVPSQVGSAVAPALSVLHLIQ